MAWYDSIIGSSDKMEQFPTKNPQQLQALHQALQQIMSGKLPGGNRLYGEGTDFLSSFLGGGKSEQERRDQFAAPYLKQFNQQTVPGIAERFAGLGSGNQSSSGFQTALAQAGTGLQENLASLFSQRQFDAANLGLNYANAPGSHLSNLLNIDPFGYNVQQGQQGIIGSAAQGLGGAAGGGLWNWLKGIIGGK